MEPLSIGLLGLSLMAAFGIASWAALKGWQGWLEIKRLELSQGYQPTVTANTGNRIELADLRERIRKLEVIAAGIEL